MKKSQKAQKLENNYNEKIETIITLYSHFSDSFYSLDKASKELKEVTSEFSDLLSYALRFNLISINDYKALWNDNVVNGNNYTEVLSMLYKMEV